MKIVVQNVIKGAVHINNIEHASIEKGFVLLVSFEKEDSEEIIPFMVNKLVNMRVFPDSNGKTNLSINDIEGEILSISQFTLYGSIKEGRRPSFTNCLNPLDASKHYNKFNDLLH